MRRMGLVGICIVLAATACSSSESGPETTVAVDDLSNVPSNSPTSVTQAQVEVSTTLQVASEEASAFSSCSITKAEFIDRGSKYVDFASHYATQALWSIHQRSGDQNSRVQSWTAGIVNTGIQTMGGHARAVAIGPDYVYVGDADGRLVRIDDSGQMEEIWEAQGGYSDRRVLFEEGEVGDGIVTVIDWQGTGRTITLDDAGIEEPPYSIDGGRVGQPYELYSEATDSGDHLILVETETGNVYSEGDKGVDGWTQLVGTHPYINNSQTGTILSPELQPMFSVTDLELLVAGGYEGRIEDYLELEILEANRSITWITGTLLDVYPSKVDVVFPIDTSTGELIDIVELPSLLHRGGLWGSLQVSDSSITVAISDESNEILTVQLLEIACE